MSAPDTGGPAAPAPAVLKARLQAVISDTDPEMLAPLLEILAESDFTVTTPPAPGLMMMNIRESDGTVFHLGEVLVTRAEVEQADATGYGCAMGDRPEGAMALACLDALSRQNSPAPILNRLRPAIDRIHDTVIRKRESDSRLITLTRVDFRSMAEE